MDRESLFFVLSTNILALLLTCVGTISLDRENQATQILVTSRLLRGDKGGGSSDTARPNLSKVLLSVPFCQAQSPSCSAVADCVHKSPLWNSRSPGLSLQVTHHYTIAIRTRRCTINGDATIPGSKQRKTQTEQPKPGNQYSPAHSAAAVFPEHF